MSQRRRRKTVGRRRASSSKREHRVTSWLTAAEKKQLDKSVKKLNVPRYLLVRWRVTGQPIPRPPIKGRGK